MKKLILAGATSQTIDLFIQNSSLTTGGGLTGLAFNTASLTAYYRKGATGTATAITLATQTVGGAFSSGGFVEIDATNMPGMYRLDLPNAVIDTAGSAYLMLKGATNMAQLPIEIQVTGFNAEASLATPTNITAATGIVLSGVTHTGAVIPTVTTLTGHTANTGDPFARLGAPAGASVSADIAAGKAETVTILADTNDIQTRLPAALLGGRMDCKATIVGSGNDTRGADVLNYMANSFAFGTVGVGSTTTSVVVSSTNPGASAANQFKGRKLAFLYNTLTGELQSQECYIISHTAPSGGEITCTVTALTNAPASTDTFVITGHSLQTGDSFARIGAAGAGLTALATQSSVDIIDDFLDTEVVAIKAKTDLIPAAPAAVGDIPTAAQNATAVLTTQMTESYRATGAAPTLAQSQFELIAHPGESAIVGTTKTLKKLDGTTTAKTFTLNNATTPTSITETT